MATYTRIPQFEHVELQRAVPSGDQQDDPNNNNNNNNNTTIRSITISNETRADGSIVRRKETLFNNGNTRVEEKELSRPLNDPGIRYVPIVPPIPRLTSSSTTPDLILPLYHRHPRPLTTKESYTSQDRQGVLCQLAAVLVAILGLFQVLLWYTILSRQDNDNQSTFLDIFRQFQGKHE